MPSLETAARSLNVVATIAPVHSDAEIEAAIVALGREPGRGLVVTPDIFMIAHRVPIILAAARNNVPAVYGISDFTRDGGLLSYGVDLVDIFRRAASYVDRILRGEKPGDLQVQFPTKFEMVVNPQDRQGAWSYCTPIDSAARHRGDRRITAGYVGLWHLTSFAAVHKIR
jgi:putative ABC transport system substrate-binding protein